MITPRGNFVLAQIVEQVERKVGGITMPAGEDCYCEAEIVAVGPGNILAAGALPDTHDLKPGQRVWLNHRRAREGAGGLRSFHPMGITYIQDGKTFFLFDQMSILGIIAQPSGH